ncbi:MAG TPA: hypothetical protein VF007_00650 [Stellaceae bacterium]
MAKSILTSYGVEHPAPFAGAVSKWLLFTALLAAPIAWFIQLFVDYGLTSQACFPARAADRDRPRPLAPGVGRLARSDRWRARPRLGGERGLVLDVAANPARGRECPRLDRGR